MKITLIKNGQWSRCMARCLPQWCVLTLTLNGQPAFAQSCGNAFCEMTRSYMQRYCEIHLTTLPATVCPIPRVPGYFICDCSGTGANISCL